MVTYIKKNVPFKFVEFAEPLDPIAINNIGTTLEDYENGDWVLLSDEQVAFHEANPDVTVEEVWNMEVIQPTPIPEKTLQEVKEDAIREITTFDYSKEVNGFIVNDVIDTWFSVQERLNYRESINAAKLLGKETVSFFIGDTLLEVGCDLGIGMLAQIQDYADQCYIVTKTHKLNVNKMTTKEEVAQLLEEIKTERKGYPAKLSFTLQ